VCNKKKKSSTLFAFEEDFGCHWNLIGLLNWLSIKKRWSRDFQGKLLVEEKHNDNKRMRFHLKKSFLEFKSITILDSNDFFKVLFKNPISLHVHFCSISINIEIYIENEEEAFSNVYHRKNDSF
jgi:hypothetical protein